MPRSGFSAKGLGFTGGSAPTWIDNVLATPVYGVAYSDSVSASGNATYARISGTFPTGFTLDTSTGIISGTHKTFATGAPTQTFAFTIRATNSFGSITQAFTWVISTPFEWTVTSGSYTTYTRGIYVGIRFTTNATFVITNGRREFVYKELISGGGGGGGGVRNSYSFGNFRYASGGGGAGGRVVNVVGPNNSPTTEGTYPIVIGAGGAGGAGLSMSSPGTVTATNGSPGTISTFNSYTSTSGGGGGDAGASGAFSPISTSSTGGSVIQGGVTNTGGSGFTSGSFRSGGGGAGAGGNGTSANIITAGGAGHPGYAATQFEQTVSVGGQGGSPNATGTISTLKASGGGGGYAGTNTGISRNGTAGQSGVVSIEWLP